MSKSRKFIVQARRDAVLEEYQSANAVHELSAISLDALREVLRPLCNDAYYYDIYLDSRACKFVGVFPGPAAERDGAAILGASWDELAKEAA